MKIAIDARSVFPGKGGIGCYTQNLVAGLARVDVENEYLLFCCAAKGNAPVAQAANVREAVFHTGMMDVTWEQLEKRKKELQRKPSLAQDWIDS